jgi:hypothetical protein
MLPLNYYRNLADDLTDSDMVETAADIRDLADEVERLRDLLETHLNLPPAIPRCISQLG